MCVALVSRYTAGARSARSARRERLRGAAVFKRGRVGVRKDIRNDVEIKGLLFNRIVLVFGVGSLSLPRDSFVGSRIAT